MLSESPVYLLMVQDSAQRSVGCGSPRSFGEEGLTHCHSWHVDGDLGCL
jgi:hypothetical protein